MVPNVGLNRVPRASIPLDPVFSWSVGNWMEQFFDGMKESKILASRCPTCGRVYLPPLMICERCFVKADEWVELPDTGTVQSFTEAHVKAGKGGGLEDLESPEIIAMVIGESQASVYGCYVPGSMMLDPTFDRQRWLLNELSAAALQARAYMNACFVSEEQLAGVAAKNLDNAAKNPLALRAMAGADAGKVLSSRLLYSPIRELMAYEALGLCAAGGGGDLLDSGATRIDGSLPVNASGGALAANVVCAAGLARIIEAAMQIRGEAGDHQVPGVKTALAHGQTGLCAQENIVYVLGRE